MTTETFAEAIAVSGTAGGTITLTASPNGTRATLTEDDGTLDSSTPIDGQMVYAFTDFPGFPTSEVTFFAMTPEGPVVEFSDGALNLLTNNSSLTSGTELTSTTAVDYLYCFAAGTEISTPLGKIEVENLCIGDEIYTHEMLSVPVKWIGRQTVSTRFGMAERLMPVRVRAGALGCGLPLRDLVLTADHALLIDGLLINAGALVNGTTIDWVPLSELGESYTVYHIETENHDVILAEGTPAETFIDYVSRQAFDNYAEYLALYGEEPLIAEMAYPRISTARLLPLALKRRLQVDRVA